MKKDNASGQKPLALPLWDEDKMKKMKLSLASFILQKIYYKKKRGDIKKV